MCGSISRKIREERKDGERKELGSLFAGDLFGEMTLLHRGFFPAFLLLLPYSSSIIEYKFND